MNSRPIASEHSIPPDLLIVHGPWQHTSWWRPLQHVLTDGGQRCWVPPLPGGDRHDPSCLTVTLEDLAATVLATIETIDQPQDLTVIVHGLAGPIGQLVAAAAPETITRIVWIDAVVLDSEPGGMDHLGDQLDHHLRNLAMQAERGLPVPIDLLTWSAFFAQGTSDDAYEAAARTIRDLVCPPGWLAHEVDVSAFWDQAATDAWDQAYLHYLHDRVLPYDKQREAVEQLRPDRTAAIPGSHTDFFTRPDVAAAAVLDLCRSGLTGHAEARSAAAHDPSGQKGL